MTTDFDNITIDVSSGEENNECDSVHLKYAREKLFSNELRPVLFARQCKFAANANNQAQEYMAKVVKAIADEARTDDKRPPKQKLVNMKKNVKWLQTYDWESLDGEWQTFWQNRQIIASRRLNDLKRLQEGDEELTNSVKRARQMRSALEAPAKATEDLLRLRMWSLVPSGTASPDVYNELNALFTSADENTVRVIDLRTSESSDILLLSDDLGSAYGAMLDNWFDNLLSEDVRSTLEQFFSKVRHLEASKCEAELNALTEQGSSDAQKMVAVVKATLPVFFRAFARDDNPLKSASTLEAEHLHTFIHPIIRECCARFAPRVVWRGGEIPSEYFVSKNKADGVGMLTGREKVPLAYFEGSRAVASAKKGAADEEKIAMNLAHIFASTVKKLLASRQRLADELLFLGAQSIGLRVICSVMEYRGQLYLHEFNSANVPAQASEALMFVSLYECLAGWTVIMQKTALSIDASQLKKRTSRVSNIAAVKAIATPPSKYVEAAFAPTLIGSNKIFPSVTCSEPALEEGEVSEFE
ncbi:hypothetical protein HDU89_000724 [Geranomyces variabilis]|nr:hypothetical protein HDU89_000724 [Geranomyces variabilis]